LLVSFLVWMPFPMVGRGDWHWADPFSTGPLRLGGGVIGDLACDRIDARHDLGGLECDDPSRTGEVLAVIVAKTEKRLSFRLRCFPSVGVGRVF
jgi:hypothetical protein